MLGDVIALFAVGTGTALATGLGAIPVFLLAERASALQPAMLGLAAGVMAVAAIAGLLLPGLDQGSAASVGAGVLFGIVFLLVARQLVGRWHRGAAEERAIRTSLLVFAVLFVHSAPEGFAIGTAYASDTAGLGLFVIVAIAIQNIPEGTAVAIPMAAAGQSAARQFWAAVATSAPQPIAAPAAFLLVEQIQPLLPVSFGFAAGAMLSLVTVEVAPAALRTGRASWAIAGAAIGAAAMTALSLFLGI
jgi:ZIP family zinc transporter